MRHLTASQKIAILENRVAHLEKQAMLEGLKAKIADAMSPFKRLFPHTKKIIKDTRKSPKQIAQEYMKVRKDPNFKKAMKQLQREAGPSPVKQVAYVIDAYESGELEARPRTASMRRRGGFLLGMTFATGLSAAIMATLYILDICIQWVLGKVKGSPKLGSMDKEAGVGGFFFGLIFIISVLGGAHFKAKKEEEDFAERRRREEERVKEFIKGVLSPFVEVGKISKLRNEDTYRTVHHAFAEDVTFRVGPKKRTGYVFLNGEEWYVKVEIYDDGKARLYLDNKQVYYDRMTPPVSNRVKKILIESTLEELGVI